MYDSRREPVPPTPCSNGAGQDNALCRPAWQPLSRSRQVSPHKVRLSAGPRTMHDKSGPPGCTMWLWMGNNESDTLLSAALAQQSIFLFLNNIHPLSLFPSHTEIGKRTIEAHQSEHARVIPDHSTHNCCINCHFINFIVPRHFLQWIGPKCDSLAVFCFFLFVFFWVPSMPFVQWGGKILWHYGACDY